MSITCAACGRVLRKGADRCIFCEEKKYLEEVRVSRDEKIRAESQVELNYFKSRSEKADVLRATEESAEAARIKGFPLPDLKNPSDTQSSTFKFCHLCGEKLLNNGKFCSSCGAQIQDEIVTQVPMSADNQSVPYWSPPTPTAKDYFRAFSRFMVKVMLLLLLVILGFTIFQYFGGSSGGNSSSGGGNSSSSSGDWGSGTTDDPQIIVTKACEFVRNAMRHHDPRDQFTRPTATDVTAYRTELKKAAKEFRKLDMLFPGGDFAYIVTVIGQIILGFRGLDEATGTFPVMDYCGIGLYGKD